MRLNFTLLLCALASFLVGCPTTTSCPPGSLLDPESGQCAFVAGDAGTCAPCDDPARPVCDPGSLECVECVDDASCGSGVCDPLTHECVECLANADCAGSAGGSVCGPDGACVECTSDGHCDGACRPDNTCTGCLDDTHCSSPTAVCDTTAELCVACLADADCGADAPLCDASSATCGACAAHADCNRFVDAPVCSDGACVECTPETEVDACGGNSCHPIELRCTDTPIGSLALCQECAADSQCESGACVDMPNGLGQDVGYCAPTRDEPGDLCSTLLPDEANDVTTLSGATVHACLPQLSVTSCPGIQHVLQLMDAIEQPCSSDADCNSAGGGVCRTIATFAEPQCTARCVDHGGCPGLTLTCTGDVGTKWCGGPGA